MTELGNLTVVHNGGNGNLLVDFDGSNQGAMLVRQQLSVGATSIKSIRIKIDSNIATNFYVDRIEVLSNSYKYSELLLKQIKYNLTSLGLFADLSFGGRVDSIIDEINDKVKDGDIALNIFAKQ